jgi:hypothetical protein
MLTSLTIYTDKLPPDVGGCANGPVVRIRTKYRADTGIHAHEAEHVRQWWMGVLIGALAALTILLTPTIWSAWWPLVALSGIGLHPLAYLLLPRYRLWAEARAYRIQLKHYPDDRTELFAGFIAGRYGLMVSAEEVLLLLKDGRR